MRKKIKKGNLNKHYFEKDTVFKNEKPSSPKPINTKNKKVKYFISFYSLDENKDASFGNIVLSIKKEKKFDVTKISKIIKSQLELKDIAILNFIKMKD